VSVTGFIADARDFMLRRPASPTLVSQASPEEREDLAQRILQRIDFSVAHYAILNVHRIGVDAPGSFVFEQFRTWGPESSWWPNHIARLEAADPDLEHLRVFFLGRKQHLIGLKLPLLGLNVIPLFDMNLLKMVPVPDACEPDNARYMVYRCGGGYPVGILAIYIRSAIPSRQESGQTHVFFAVGFNFYGRADWPRKHLINSIWEAIHNRVTGNVLNRFKVECEARFARVLAGRAGPRSEEIRGRDP
jgi:hypothetical protein